MQTRVFRSVGLALAVAAATAGAISGAQAQTATSEILVLRNNTLVRIASNAPGTAKSTVPVTGLAMGENLIGIDVRASNGVLYGLAGSGRLYTINPTSGAATPGAQLATAPTGTNFGVDFNPVADRLRVVSNTGQSLRVNVADGATTVDTSVTYGASDAGNGTTPVVVAAAYTNPDNDPATGTELLVIESARDVLALQAPPNDGILASRGALGRDAGATTGFDISPAGEAMAVIGGTLVNINTSTGQATDIGAVVGGAVDGMTFILPVPAAAPATTTTTPGATTSTTIGLARTGGSSSNGTLAGVGALLLGAGALLRTARRRTTS